MTQHKIVAGLEEATDCASGRSSPARIIRFRRKPQHVEAIVSAEVASMLDQFCQDYSVPRSIAVAMVLEASLTVLRE